MFHPFLVSKIQWIKILLHDFISTPLRTTPVVLAISLSTVPASFGLEKMAATDKGADQNQFCIL